jgi:hypothetical protein
MRLLMLLLLAVPCAAEEIPLSEIWSNGMPGTNWFRLKVKDLPRDHPARRALLDIDRKLGYLGDKEAGSAFVVEGVGLDAILALSERLAEKPISANYPKGRPVCAVFYAHAGRAKVQINSVTKTGGGVDIVYSEIKHQGEAINLGLPHFVALIPLGEIETDEFQVKITTKDGKHPGQDARVCKPSMLTADESR